MLIVATEAWTMRYSTESPSEKIVKNIKAQFVRWHTRKTKRKVKMAFYEYCDGRYNQRHSSLDWGLPVALHEIWVKRAPEASRKRGRSGFFRRWRKLSSHTNIVRINQSGFADTCGRYALTKCESARFYWSENARNNVKGSGRPVSGRAKSF